VSDWYTKYNQEHDSNAVIYLMNEVDELIDLLDDAIALIVDCMQNTPEPRHIEALRRLQTTRKKYQKSIGEDTE
jgi:hypothetical protein